jgi:hypothetical protein
MLKLINIKEIVQSFATSLNHTKKEVELAEIRYKICKSCGNLNKGLIETCNICGCIIKKKIFSPRNPACPIKKW